MAVVRVAGRPRPLVAATVCVGVAAVLAGCSSGSSGTSSTPAAPALITATTTTTPASPTANPTATPTPTPTAVPPFVARAQWVRGTGGRSLHIVPTASGRAAQGTTDDDEAWAEVVRLAPDAYQPGMRAQFDCHWTFARVVDPDKPSWNIEPWRPVVTDSQMVDAQCNPGAPES
ncbi:MAG: DUF2599 domain-containing protein, partial [Lapillicoccus sp.]